MKKELADELLAEYIQSWKVKKICRALILKGYVSNEKDAKSFADKYKIDSKIDKHLVETYFVNNKPFLKISIGEGEVEDDNELGIKYVAEIL